MKLIKDVKFVNKTFENSDSIVPNFARLVTSKDKFKWPFCHLNNFYTGNIEAVS